MSKPKLEAIYALAPTQQGMLFESLAMPGSGIHIEQMVCTLHGILNRDAFEAAWRAVLAQHAILRTAFVWQSQPEPLQGVLSEVTLPITYQNWSRLAPADQHAQLESYLINDRQQGFNLTQAPLLRLALFDLCPEQTQFVWTFHHILMDGWCVSQVLQDVLTAYQEFVAGRTPILKPGPPYRDYINWLQRQDRSQAAAFWRSTLQSFTQPTPLGLLDARAGDRPASARYGDQQATLPAATTATLQSLARRCRVTLNTVVQGLWAVLLSRYSGQDQVLFGVTVAGRPPDLPNSEAIIGLFINTLPMPVTVLPQASFWDWLPALQAYTSDLQQYAYTSTGQVQQWSSMPRALPLYESIVVFENYPTTTLSTGDLTFTIADTQASGARTNYALTLLATAESTLHLRLIYDRQRFDAAMIERILEHLLTVAEQVAAAPTTSLAALASAIPDTAIPRVRPRLHGGDQPVQRNWTAPRTSQERQLAEIMARVLGVERVSIHDNFFALGGDSLLSLHFIAQAAMAGLKLSPKQVFEHQTIAELATVVNASAEQTIHAEQGMVTGPLPISPNHGISFETYDPDRHIWNVSELFEVEQRLEPALLVAVVRALIVHHDALRICLIQEPSGWRLFIAPPPTAAPFTRFDFSSLPQAEHKLAIESAAAELQGSFNLQAGPLLRIALFDLGPDTPQRLMLLTHHTVCDLYSARILWEDFLTAYGQLSRGAALQLPSKTTSIKYYIEREAAYTQSGARDHELDYWLAEARKHVQPLPLDYPHGVHTGASARKLAVGLDHAETGALQQMTATSSSIQIVDILVTALTQAFNRWTGDTKLLFDLEHHGRETCFPEVDLSRTVGWFNYRTPVLVELDPASEPAAALQSIQAQLRAIPNRGIGYGMLRYLRDDPAIAHQLRSLPQPRILFNYRGSIIAPELPAVLMVRAAPESKGNEYSAVTQRQHLFLIDAEIIGNQLRVNWTYSDLAHDRATVERLAERFMVALRALLHGPPAQQPHDGVTL